MSKIMRRFKMTILSGIQATIRVLDMVLEGPRKELGGLAGKNRDQSRQ